VFQYSNKTSKQKKWKPFSLEKLLHVPGWMSEREGWLEEKAQKKTELFHTIGLLKKLHHFWWKKQVSSQLFTSTTFWNDQWLVLLLVFVAFLFGITWLWLEGAVGSVRAAAAAAATARGLVQRRTESKEGTTDWQTD
jgi:hypothetical protein